MQLKYCPNEICNLSGRLSNSGPAPECKYLIALPSKGNFTKLIILKFHLQNLQQALSLFFQVFELNFGLLVVAELLDLYLQNVLSVLHTNL